MNLSNLSIEIRPRTNWEAFDLGRSLLRKYWKIVYGPWITANLCLMLLLAPVCLYSVNLAVFLYVFFIPVAERIILLIISRAVFGDTLRWKESMKQWPGQVKSGLISYNIFYRILPLRTMILPIWQLENLQGKHRSNRIKTINHQASNSAGWIGFFFTILELLTTGFILKFILDFIPQGLIDWELFWIDLFLVGPPLAFTVIVGCVYLLVVWMVRPILVAGGFSLYLHRRMVLEGWDIELQFRSLVNRLTKILIPAIVILSSFCGHSLRAEDSPQKTVERIMKMEEFEKFKEIEGRRSKNKGEEKSKERDFSDISFGAFFVKIILIIFVVLLIGGLIYFIVKTLQENKISVSRTDKIKEPIRKIMGMDITEETLPDDIASEAESLIRQGQLRAGLALLYRGALFKLVNQYGVALKKSFTENDCLRAVKSPVPSVTSSYFKDLTNQWLLLAYAHVEPEQDNALRFCKQWNSAFKAAGREVS